MNPQQIVRHSKFLSLVLRHQPGKIGLTLDEQGWVDVELLLTALKENRHQLSREQLEVIVRDNDKQRFAFDATGQKIRASQGHSIDIQLEYQPVKPPGELYHGTPQQFVEAIKQQGLTKQKRHAVHMHTSIETAVAVGQRRGKPVLLTIDAAEMYSAGYKFFVTPNDVWLTDHVPPEYISFPTE